MKYCKLILLPLCLLMQVGCNLAMTPPATVTEANQPRTQLAARNFSQDAFSIESEFNDSPQGESASMLFDGDKGSKFLTRKKSSWVSFTAQQPQILTSYQLTSAVDAPGRDPKHWIVEASNDGINWQVIDQQNNQDFTSRRLTKIFKLDNKKAFSKYRFHLTQSHKTQWGDEYLQLAEIELFSFTRQPIAQFTAKNPIIKHHESVSFNDLSKNHPTKWHWTFEGATPSFSNQQHPTVIYSKPGSYQVTLRASNEHGEDVETKSKIVKVLDPSNPWQGFSYPEVVLAHEDTSSAGYQRINTLMPDISKVINNITLDVNKKLYKNFTEVPDFKKVIFTLQWSDVLASRGGSGDTMLLTFSTKYIEQKLAAQPDDQVLYELEGVFWHELTHGYQHAPANGIYQGGNEYHAFLEGVADLVRINAGYHKTRQPKLSDNWLGGYTNTGFFLDWIRQHKESDFTYKFNQTALTLKPWSFNRAFEQILGQGVQPLWDEYQQHLKAQGAKQG